MSKGHRANLRGISDGKRLESPPYSALEEIADEKDWTAFGKSGNKDKPSVTNEQQDHCPSVTELIRYRI
jgi:hypothetical protein